MLMSAEGGASVGLTSRMAGRRRGLGVKPESVRRDHTLNEPGHMGKDWRTVYIGQLVACFCSWPLPVSFFFFLTQLAAEIASLIFF